MTVMDKGELVRALRRRAEAIWRDTSRDMGKMKSGEFAAVTHIALEFEALADELEASTEEKADGLD